MLLAVAGLLWFGSWAPAGGGGQGQDQLMTASTVRSVEIVSEGVVLTLADGTSLQALPAHFRVLATASQAEVGGEPPTREQRRDPVFQEQRRQQRAAERGARRPAVTELQVGQAVLVIARLRDDGSVRSAIVRVFDDLAAARAVLQERQQRLEERQSLGEERDRPGESGSSAGPVVDGPAADG